MKRIIATLLFCAAYADTTDGGDTSGQAEDTPDQPENTENQNDDNPEQEDGNTDQEDGESEEQVDPQDYEGLVFRYPEPIDWESIFGPAITEDSPYSLTGTYHGYIAESADYVSIQTVVNGRNFEQLIDGSIASNSYVLTWIEINDPDNAGIIEGVYCMALYEQEAENSETNETQSFQGSEIDFATVTGKPSEWYTDGEVDAQLQSNPAWKLMTDSLEEFYASTWDEEALVSSQACTVWRERQFQDNYLEIKFGTAYEVRTGYKIYPTDEFIPIHEITGVAVEMTFDGAINLAAASVVLSTIVSMFTF